MKRVLFVPLVGAFVVAIVAAMASTALAFPTETSPCTDCHATTDAAVTISAVPGTAGPATTQYTITVAKPYSGAVGWAVFQGTNKFAGGSGTGGVVSLTNGVSYTVFGATLNGSGTKVSNSQTVNVPVPADTWAPTTTSDAKASYYLSAVITLSAHDTGSSGVAHTYYKLDSADTTEGLTVSTSVVGTHTLEFWSVDASGNAEVHNVADFTVTTTPPAPAVYTFTYKFKTKNKAYKNLKAVLKNVTTGKTYTAKIPKSGKISITGVLAGNYRLSTKGNSKFKFKAKTIAFHV